MGLDATFYTNTKQPEEICDISSHYYLHQLICAHARALVSEEYTDVYVTELDLILIAYHLKQLMLRLGLKPIDIQVWNLSDEIPIDRDDYEACLPYYLKIIQTLQARLEPFDSYIYASSC